MDERERDVRVKMSGCMMKVLPTFVYFHVVLAREKVLQ